MFDFTLHVFRGAKKRFGGGRAKIKTKSSLSTVNHDFVLFYRVATSNLQPFLEQKFSED